MHIVSQHMEDIETPSKYLGGIRLTILTLSQINYKYGMINVIFTTYSSDDGIYTDVLPYSILLGY